MKTLILVGCLALSGCVDDGALVNGLARFSAGYAHGVAGYQAAHPYVPPVRPPLYDSGYINGVPYYRIGDNVYVGY